MSTPWDAPLTRGERAWLRRRADGVSLSERAARDGVTRAARRAMEADPSPAPEAHRQALTDAQRVRLARHRSGLGSVAVAARLGVSRVTLAKWERAADPRLRRFWERFKD